MTITAKIIADSVGPVGQRLTTMELRYPRFIHSEFMTHRMFSRNASSSRAIPVAKIIEQVQWVPAMPVHWGKNQPGMQAREELIGIPKAVVIGAWLDARDQAVRMAEAMVAAGAHKQIVNRVLEPFQHISVIVSGIEAAFANFFHLRAHPDAQPEIQELASKMRDAYLNGIPRVLNQGDWHLPYVTADELKDLAGQWELLRKLSVARCARVSYLNHDGSKPNIKKDIELHDQLVVQQPAHASPAEHQATPDAWYPHEDGWDNPSLHGNLIGWIQYRKCLPGEFHTTISK